MAANKTIEAGVVINAAVNGTDEVDALAQAFANARAAVDGVDGGNLDELEASLEETAPSLYEVAQGVGKVVTSAGGLAYAANEAMKFETAMAQVKKVTEGTPEQYAQLSDSIKALASWALCLPSWRKLPRWAGKWA